MNRTTKKEIVATLLRAGRRDLAQVVAGKKRKLTDRMASALDAAKRLGVVPGGSFVTHKLAWKLQDLGLLEGGQVLRPSAKGEQALKDGFYFVD
jgi:hypothetical protein